MQKARLDLGDLCMQILPLAVIEQRITQHKHFFAMGDEGIVPGLNNILHVGNGDPFILRVGLAGFANEGGGGGKVILAVQMGVIFEMTINVGTCADRIIPLQFIRRDPKNRVSGQSRLISGQAPRASHLLTAAVDTLRCAASCSCVIPWRNRRCLMLLPICNSICEDPFLFVW